MEYHLEECQKAEVSRIEVIEVLKMAMIGGGSILYPSARKILKHLNEMAFK